MPTNEFILLSEAQQVFAFRTLKQAICFVDRHTGQIRQERCGRRRYVHVADFAAALLDDPLAPQQETWWWLQEAIASLRKENASLRQRLDDRSYMVAGAYSGQQVQKLQQENASLRQRLTDRSYENQAEYAKLAQKQRQEIASLRQRLKREGLLID